MEISNSFDVNSPISQVWAVLTDLERIAPCLPGAELTQSTPEQNHSGIIYEGVIKVKVGPVSVKYNGTASFTELDEANHRAVLVANGTGAAGAGNASATITAHLEALDDSSTRVHVDTDMTITGKLAQFGRGIMGDISSKMMNQFADNLSQVLAD